MVGIMTNLKTAALTQVEDWDFNGLVEFQGRLIGTNATGVHRLLVGELDGVAKISAFFEPLLTDFGSANQKRARKVYLGAESTGDLELTVKTDEGDERSYQFTAGDEDDRQRTSRVTIGRDGRGRYWTFRVSNVEGSDFAVDAMDVDMVILSRRRP